MISHQTRVLDSMNRIKDMIKAQQEALKQRLSQEQRFNAPSEYDDDAPGYHDKLDGAGGFAGADAKKRRGVSRARPHPLIFGSLPRSESCASWTVSQLQPSRDARVATGPRWCSHPLQCMWFALVPLDPRECSTAKDQVDYAKLTRKMGSKASSSSSNLRPKEMNAGSPQ